MRLSALALLLAPTVVPAHAACSDDLVKADQSLHRTRAELQQAATAAPAVKCAAYRRHVASLTQVRDVFTRCDTSAAKAANAGQVNASLAEFNKQMRASCAGAAKK